MNEYNIDEIEFIDLSEDDIASLDLPNTGTFKVKAAEVKMSVGGSDTVGDDI